MAFDGLVVICSIQPSESLLFPELWYHRWPRWGFPSVLLLTTLKMFKRCQLLITLFSLGWTQYALTPCRAWDTLGYIYGHHAHYKIITYIIACTQRSIKPIVMVIVHNSPQPITVTFTKVTLVPDQYFGIDSEQVIALSQGCIQCFFFKKIF